MTERLPKPVDPKAARGAFEVAVLGVAALGISWALACRGRPEATAAKGEPAPPGSSVSPPPPGVSVPAFEAYEAAKQAIRAANFDEARDLLKRAVEVQPDFTEAWYNLGATTSRLSMAAAGDGRDQEAIALFREAVEEKRRAQALIDEGKWFVYKTREEQEQVIFDLRHALEDADEVLADEASLIAALRLWAASGRVR